MSDEQIVTIAARELERAAKYALGRVQRAELDFGDAELIDRLA